MESTLHRHDALAAHISEDEVAAVSLHCRHGEIGYFRIGNIKFVFDIVGEVAETCSEDDGEFGHLSAALTEVVGCLFDFFEHSLVLCCYGIT